MINSVRILFAIFIVSIAFIGCKKEFISPPTALNCNTDFSSHENNKQYQEALKLYTQSNIAPGSIIGVKKHHNEEWISATGFSNLEYNTPMQPCSQFRTGSITKIFTAVVAIQLIESDSLSLESTVSSILPDIKIPNANQITVQQLLNHTSGLSHPTSDDLSYQLSLINNPDKMKSMTYQERLNAFVYDKPLVHSPGSDSYYSNAGYWVLALIIEKITGKSIPYNIEKRIINPLNLTSTYLESKENPNVSRGYNFSGNKLRDVTLWDIAETNNDPAGGMISNAHDLLAFAEALFNGMLVSPSSLYLMKITTNFSSCNGDCGYGLGIENWKVNDNVGYGKNGFSMGVDANLIYFPEKYISVVIFSNYGGGNSKEVIEKLLEI